MKVMYQRVSTAEQSLARQSDMVEKLGIERVFEEKVSGKDMNRPQLQAMLEFLREGDTLVVESISRLGRSTLDLLRIVGILREKGVNFVSTKENLDTSTPAGRFVFTLFSSLAELERESILARQEEGIASAKVRGVAFGRPAVSKPKDYDAVVSRVRAGEITSVEAMKILGMKRSSYYKFFGAP